MPQRKLTIPVSSDTYDLLQQLAYEQGESLAAFCRARIMARENLSDEFSALQRTVIAAIGDAVKAPPVSSGAVDERRAGQGDQDANFAMVAEVLLILRSMVPPQKVQAVHGELKRLGVEPFSR